MTTFGRPFLGRFNDVPILILAARDIHASTEFLVVARDRPSKAEWVPFGNVTVVPFESSLPGFGS